MSEENKTIWRIWLGRPGHPAAPPPDRVQRWLDDWDTWAERNGWHHTTLGPDDLAERVPARLIKKAHTVWPGRDHALKALSDLLRYTVLADVGGWYVDIDVRIERPSVLLPPCVGLGVPPTLYSVVRPNEPCNSIMACGPQDGFVERVSTRARAALEGTPDNVQSTAVPITGPHVLHRVLEETAWPVTHHNPPRYIMQGLRRSPEPTGLTALLSDRWWAR